MSNEQLAADGVVHGDDLCIRDPGGDDRGVIATDEADHSPSVDPDALDAMLAPVGDALLASADIRPGETVLDIGCGGGATTLAASRAVGPNGSVTGVDLTPEMLELARTRLAAGGKANVELLEGDAAKCDLKFGYDAAISRFGTMFFDDPVAAFVNIRQALKPGGRVCIATWQPLDANAWLVVPGAALLRWIELPDVSGTGPGMFSQSDPAIIAATLRDSGYVDVNVSSVKIALTLGATPDEAVERLIDTGVGRAAIGAVPDASRFDALAAVRAALADHCDATGIHLGAAILITTARART
jgi:SAM-dependent methyltransferase